MKAVVDSALSAGALAVSSATLPFVIKDSQLRVTSTMLNGDGARLLIAGGYDIAADQIDVRADLSPSAGATSFAGRPEIQVMLFGSPDAPDRMIDIAALSAWLGLRAIDRETRRLESLERSEKPVEQPKIAPQPAPSVPSALPPAAQLRAPPLPPPIEVRPAPGVARPPKQPTGGPLVITPGPQRPAY